MGTTGCVSYLFSTKGVILMEKKDGMDDDEVMMAVLDAGADDINLDGDTYEILTDANALSQVRENLEAAGYALISSEVDKIPATTVALDNEGVEKVQRMLNWFDDNDDVQNVYHNAELPEEEEEE